MYGGLGPTIGSLVGGPLTKAIGLQSTFRWGAAVDAIALALYSSFLLLQKFSNYGNKSINSAGTDTGLSGAVSSTRLKAVNNDYETASKGLIARIPSHLQKSLPLLAFWILYRIIV